MKSAKQLNGYYQKTTFDISALSKEEQEPIFANALTEGPEPVKIRIAKSYSTIIQQCLTKKELAEAIASNAKDGLCSAGKYFDSNVAMSEAYEQEMGEAMDTTAEFDLGLANEAWKIAVENNYYTN